MNLRVPFKGAAKRAPQRVKEITPAEGMLEREGNLSLRKNYLSDCSDISTPNPLITAASEHDFRSMFGIAHDQQSLVIKERKGRRQPAKEYGLLIGTPIPGQCLRFSLVFNEVEMHAVIKTAPGADRLHLDAAQVMLGDSAHDIACGDAGVEKAFLEDLIGYFRDTAVALRDQPQLDKSLLEQLFMKKVERIEHDMILSGVAEAHKTAKPAETHRHLNR